MTATELYDTDGEFQAWVEKWVEDRRPPFPLADWLAERELPLLAKAVQWCIDQGTRKVNMPYYWYGESTEPCGVYPATLVGDRIRNKSSDSITLEDFDWFWFCGTREHNKTSEELTFQHWLHEDFTLRNEDISRFSSPQEAILYMLDHYHEDAQKERKRRSHEEIRRLIEAGKVTFPTDHSDSL